MSTASPFPDDAGPATVADRLLAWYDRHARRLPWRAPPGARPDPYHVWLSEVMLQQTTVATVGSYFRDFVARWPTVEHLAAAELDDVLTAWAGLGYYARARNLHKCARAVAADHDGRFPDTEAALRQLPGVGAYTAAAIAAIAFDRPAAVMDGNVERVVARLNAIDAPLPGAKPALHERVRALTPTRRPGDFAQAMMDLGATVCTPRKPRCMLCPVAESCRGLALGVADSLPVKAARRPRPTRRAVAFFLTDPSGAVLLRRRPEAGLLGGMMEVPSTPWEPDGATALDPARAAAPAAADWRELPGRVRHTFTHFHLELVVAVGRLDGSTAPGAAPAPDPTARWVAVDRLGEVALPTLTRKIVDHAFAHAGRDLSKPAGDPFGNT